MRERYRWDPNLKELVRVRPSRAQALHFIQPDLPGYESPIDGRWIEGRRARRDDLARSNCRPWEGREQEEKEAAKRRSENERRLDNLAERMAHRAWAEAPERIRKVFRSR
jgi:hypothetical protein